MRVAWLIIGLLAGVVACAGAQSSSYEVSRFLKEAHKYEEREEWRAAQRAYQAVLVRDRKNTIALRGLARIAQHRGRWGEAAKRWGDVLKQEPEDIEAYYYRAISLREVGVTRPPIVRSLLPWKKAEAAFQWIVAHDSLYRDVWYQWALLKQYQGKYEESLALGHRQVTLKPEDVEAWLGLFRLYGYFIRHRPGAAILAYREAHPHWPLAQYAWAEYWRRKGAYERAEQLYQQILQEFPQFSVQPLYLALARIAFARGEDAQGEQWFWEAVKQIRQPLDAWLVFEDVKYVVAPEEWQTYRQLTLANEYREFFRQFWLRRDPMPAAPTNLRLAEHYRRLLYAEQHFVYDGFRLWFNNPDKFGQIHWPDVYALNHIFNDKGLIFIRHGPPDERVFTTGSDLPANESWRYLRRGDQPEMVFHFMIDAVGGAGNNWRLVPMLEDRRLLIDRVHWGRIYHQLLFAEDDLQRIPLLQEMAEASDQTIQYGLTSDRHTWPSYTHQWNTAAQIAYFKGSAGKTDVRLFFALPLEEVPDSLQVLAEWGVGVYDDHGQTLHQRRQPVRLSDKSGIYMDADTFEVVPDTYQIAFYARTLDNQYIGGWKQVHVVPAFGEELELSSLVMAHEVRLATDVDRVRYPLWVLKEWLVVPNPTRVFTRRKGLALYYELYGLGSASDGRTAYTLELTLRERPPERKGLKRLLNIFSPRARVVLSVRTTHEQVSSEVAEGVSVDLQSVPAGKYWLEITVTDRQTGKTVRQKQEIVVVE